jgi:hypothetical protein
MYSHLPTELTSSYSAVYATISTNQPYVVPVNEAFTKVGPINVSSLPLGMGELTGEVPIDVPSVLEWFHLAAVSNTLGRLDTTACIQAYGSDFRSAQSHLVLMTADENSTAPVQCSDYFLVTDYDLIRYPLYSHSPEYLALPPVAQQYYPSGYSGVCTRDPSSCVCPSYNCKKACRDCYRQEVLPDASSWMPLRTSSVSCCLSEKTPEHCKLHFSLHLVIVVIVFKFLESTRDVLCCFWSIIGTIDDLGDALSSCLTEPDTSTRGCCLFLKKDFDWTMISKGNRVPGTNIVHMVA